MRASVLKFRLTYETFLQVNAFYFLNDTFVLKSFLITSWGTNYLQKSCIVLELQKKREFPGCLVVKTRCFQRRGHRFNPWLENYDPTCHAAQSQKIKRKRIKKNVIYVKYNHTVNLILKSRFFQHYEINDNEFIISIYQ